MSLYDSLTPTSANHAPLSPIRLLSRAVRYFGARTSVVEGTRRWTWTETGERCRAIASALIGLGITNSDTVSVLAPNGAAIFELQFGIPLTGGVVNNLNVRIEPETLAYILEHNQAKLLFVDSELSDIAQKALTLMPRPPVVIDIVDPAFDSGRRIGVCTYDELLERGDSNFESVEPRDELQPLALNYTSGTTGRPKGVVYDHRNAMIETLGNLVSWGVSGRPTILWLVPIFHANGWCYLWGMAGLGATNILVRKPSGPLILQLATQESITHICGAPVIAQMIARSPDAGDFRFDPPVRMLTAGSPPGSAEFIALEKMGIQLDQGYGLTEVWGPAVFREPDPHWQTLEPAQRAELKLQQGIPNLVLDDLIVADPETGLSVSPDGKTLGEVLFRGNIVMRGYLNDPIATNEAFRDGYFHSGDLAVSHPDGSIQIVDRAKDIIIAGGENISSVELEIVIANAPGVAAAAVVGVQDEQWGERPWAFVEINEGAAPTEAVILEHCRSHLAGFKIPKGVTFGPIPRTATGKVQKFMLRERLVKGR